MDAKNLGDMASDPAVSDDAVFDALREFADDRKDESGNIRSPTDEEEAEMERVRELLYQKRPAVMERLRQFVVSQHSHCCCRDIDDGNCCS